MADHDDHGSDISDDDFGNDSPANDDSLSDLHRVDNLCSILIPMLNRLTDVFNTLDEKVKPFDLPKIVVVGSQSVGKSSVLESLVNRQFLPRGEGTVTRCPIELRLCQTKAEDGFKEWVEFKHSPNKKWDMSKVGSEIMEQTVRLAGNNKGIVHDPIEMSIYSPNVSPLTVVDLPGIVKNPAGDQPDDIEDQTKELIYKYISKKTTIILAICAATDDIANAESLKVARRFDPLGERTLGVVTKIDKEADKNSNGLRNVLTGQIVHLNYGFIGVRNHSLDDLKDNVSMDAIHDEEERLLREIIPESASEHGTKYLAQKLSQLLVRHICKELPAVESKIADELKFYAVKIDTLGTDDIPNKSNIVSKTIHQFCTGFVGEFDGRPRKINTIHLSGGAKVKLIILDQLEQALAAVNPLEDITNDKIATAILGSTAMESSVSVPEAAYRYLVKTQIAKLLPPSLECVRNVHKELQNTVENCLDPEITFRYPRLTEHLVGFVHKFLSDQLTKVIATLQYHIEIESAFVSTSRQDFRDKLVALMADKNITDINFAQSALSNHKSVERDSVKVNEKAMHQDDDGSSSDGSDFVDSSVENVIGKAVDIASTITAGSVVGSLATKGAETLLNKTGISTHKKSAGNNGRHSSRMDDGHIVRCLIEAYFEIVRQSIRDYVPKLLTHSMIYHACENLQMYLYDQLHSPEKSDDLVRVSEEASKQRTHARGRLECLKNGEQIIKEIRQSVAF